MDPASLVDLIGTLKPLSTKVAKALRNAQKKESPEIRFSIAAVPVAAVSSECSDLAHILSQIAQALNSADSRLGFKPSPSATYINACLEHALECCSSILLTLDGDVEKIGGSRMLRSLKWKSKEKYVWNEDGSKELLVILKAQKAALKILLSAIQRLAMNTISQFKRLIRLQ
jgi:hypothetical protein